MPNSALTRHEVCHRSGFHFHLQLRETTDSESVLLKKHAQLDNETSALWRETSEARYVPFDTIKILYL